MVTCAVRGCGHRSSGSAASRKLKFYSFPKDSGLQKAWVDFCESPKPINFSTARICSRHFEKKFYFRRPIDIALGLNNPSRFRNLAENAIPTLNAPPKDGEETPQKEDEDQKSIASIDCKDLHPENTEYSEEGSQAPRYFFNTGTVHQMKKPVTTRSETKSLDIAEETESDIAEETSNFQIANNISNFLTVGNTTSPRIIILPPPLAPLTPLNTVTFQPVRQVWPSPQLSTIKPIAENVKKQSSKLSAEKKTASTKTPYMAFLPDQSALNDDVASYCDNIIDQNNEVLDESSTESPYVIVKRSVWKSMEQRLHLHVKKANEINDVEARYYEALEEIKKLKERIESITEGASGGIKALKAQVATLASAKISLSTENTALKRDKAKLEERFKKHAILLKQHFTTGQLKRLFCGDGEKRLRWTIDDIQQALVLKTESIPAYRFLQNRFSFLLPDLATLRRWAKTKKHMLEEKVGTNPSKPLSDQDKAVQNLLLLQEQTDDGVENTEMDVVEEEVAELLIEE